MQKIKIFVIIAVVGIVLAAIGGFLLTAGKTIGQSLFGRGFAEGQLKDYVASVLRQDINGVTCQSVDTDGNGYVSCDFTTATAPNQVQTIECAAWGLDGFLNRGCKKRLPGLPAR
ncbi:hypothetical protein V0288_03330 [Pannus brasiliensis CCIBt3594]|uniref:Uncharacterized protein n=1 Tax=Pannus brasiliensis CCIBt3594 TaxID=1427578 RepID=A0AAW9QEE6_9CHRO